MAFKSPSLFVLVILVSALCVEATGEESSSESAFGAGIPSFNHEINNFLIYTVSKKREDENGEYGSVLAAIIQKVLDDSGIRGISINERIMHAFRKKIYSLHTAFKKASRKGGKCVKKLLAEWQFGRKYTFKVYYNEVDVINLRNENEELRGQKRDLEESLVEQEVKRLRVEEKYQDALRKAEKKGNYYKKRFKCIAKKVSKMARQSKGRGPAKKKNFSDYSRQHQFRLKEEIKVECQSTLAFLGLHNFVATKVEVLNAEWEEPAFTDRETRTYQ